MDLCVHCKYATCRSGFDSGTILSMINDYSVNELNV